MGFSKAYQIIDEIKGNIPQYAKDALIENKEFVLDILRNDQLGKGLSPEGAPLAFADTANDIYGDGTYTKRTEEIYDSVGAKKGKKQGQPYNFEWTGETFKLMDFTINQDQYEIFSRTSKFNFLLQIYGDVFYLSEFHNHAVNIEVILPYINDKILEELAKIY